MDGWILSIDFKPEPNVWDDLLALRAWTTTNDVTTASVASVASVATHTNKQEIASKTF
jgi:hypothetical protein